MLWFAVFLCLLVSFIFSGIEAGILSLNRVRLRHRVKTKDRAARRLELLVKEPDRLLLTVVIVTNLMNIFAITLTTLAFVRWWGNWGYLVSLALFLPLCLFGLELLPKSVFRRFPYRALALLSQPLRIAYLLLAPVLSFGIRLAHRMVPADEAHPHGKLFGAREDFKYFTIESERSGALSPLERQMIHNVVDFRGLTAAQVMIPLSHLPTVRHDSEVEALVAASNGGAIDQFLVTSEDGEIIGLVNLFEALLDRATRSRVSSFVRPLGTVPPTESAPRLLRLLRASRTPVLLVAAENAPVGLVFKEDLYKRMIAPS